MGRFLVYLSKTMPWCSRPRRVLLLAVTPCAFQMFQLQVLILIRSSTTVAVMSVHLLSGFSNSELSNLCSVFAFCNPLHHGHRCFSSNRISLNFECQNCYWSFAVIWKVPIYQV